MLFGFRLLIIVVNLFAAGLVHAADPRERMVQSRPLLGTIVTIEVCADKGNAEGDRRAIAAAWQRITEIHSRMNLFDDASDVSLVNRAGGKPVKVHGDVLDLVRGSREFWRLTNGAFDVTTAPLSHLWKEAARSGELPGKAEVERTVGLVNAGRIAISPDGLVGLPDPSMRLDLNGDAQGFAADEAARVLRANGLRDFLVDAGGEVFAAGHNCEGQKWRIGISDPDVPERMIEVAELDDAAISTSGDYEKHFKIKGRKYSHIIDPSTGYPVEGAASVTVIAPTATEADAYTTALSVMGVKKGLAFVASLGAGYEALIYWRGENGALTRHVTSGYNNHRRQPDKE